MFHDLGSLEQWIKQTVQQQPQSFLSSKLIQSFGNQAMVQQLLRSLLSQEERVRHVANMSYHHSNGFDKIVLVKSKDPEYKLRLHIWWPEQSQHHIEAIHNHAWNFSSSCLTGAFQFQTYEAVTPSIMAQHEGRAAQRPEEYLYHYRTCPGAPGMNQFSMQLLDRMNLQCVYDAVIPAGSAYWFDHTVPHRVINLPGRTTSTLILQGPGQKAYADVFTEEPLAQWEDIQVPKLTSEELVTILQRYLVLLEEQH